METLFSVCLFFLVCLFDCFFNYLLAYPLICFYSSEEGEVYSWGSGYGGKLGQGHLRDRATPLRVAALKDIKVTDIACHEFHSAAVCGNILESYFC